MYDTGEVGLLVNPSGSSAALAVEDVAKQKRKLAIVTAAGSNRLTNEGCNPSTMHWIFNIDSLTSSIVKPLVSAGQKQWFLLVADFAYGDAPEESIRSLLAADGGKVIGTVKHPFIAGDFSAYALQAISSNAQVIELANSSADTVNALKSLREFGVITGGPQKVVALTVLITDIHAVGLDVAQGLQYAGAFYWDRDDRSRDWSKRFSARVDRVPNMVNAGDYSSTRHYLQAIKDLGTDDSESVIDKMKATVVDDMAFRGGRIRPDGLHVYEMLVVEVQSPTESRMPWDYCHVRGGIPAQDGYLPLSASRCNLVKQVSVRNQVASLLTRRGDPSQSSGSCRQRPQHGASMNGIFRCHHVPSGW